jgi:hypothetical protein
MASGHMNRVKRPDTWLHRPMLQNVKKALANPEPSTHGTFQTWRDVRLESVVRTKADMQAVPPGLIPPPSSPLTIYDKMATTQAGTRKDQG